jgi:hypothetical protein
MITSTIKRDESLAKIKQHRSELLQLQEVMQQPHSVADQTELEAGFDAINMKLHQALEAYLQALPALAISRCPFTGIIVYLPIDTFGFGGPWWDYEQPMRLPWDGPETFCGYTGGAALEELSEPVDHFCKPGVTLPFVVTDVLQLAGTKAVLSTLEVGGTQTYVLSHFAHVRPPEMPCINDLGSKHATLNIDQHAVKREGILLEQLTLDFALEYWIRIGKLLWIAPGDNSCLLRSDVTLCPYLNLPGEKAIVRVNRGVLSRTPLTH